MARHGVNTAVLLVLLSCVLCAESNEEKRKSGIDMYFEQLGKPEAATGTPQVMEVGTEGRLLREAAGAGDVQGIHKLLTEALVTAGRLIDVDDKNELGWTALHVGCAAGHLDVIEELITNGASVTVRDREGHSPLHFAVSCAPGLCVDRHAAVAMLLEAGAVADARDDSERTPLHVAAAKGHPKAIRVLLRRMVEAGKPHDELLNAAEKDGHSALHLAATAGHVETVQRLLEWGADVTVTNKEGQTAAERSKAHNGVQLLLRAHTPHTRGKERFMREYGEKDPEEAGSSTSATGGRAPSERSEL